MSEITTQTSTESAARPPAREDLTVSLALIGLIIAFALVQLGFQGNWPKVLRVSLAFLTYSTILLWLTRWTARSAVESASLPYWILAVAAAAAELCSGWLRPDWRMSDVWTIPVVAAILIGGLHWLVLRV